MFVLKTLDLRMREYQFLYIFYVSAQSLGLLIPYIAIISIRNFECIIKAASSQ